MPATQPTLSRTEWQAVSIAIKDAANCGCTAAQPGPVRRLYEKLTGNVAPRPLADERLEAIRGFVCTTHRTRRPADQYRPVLERQGFSAAQVDALALLSI